MEHAQSSQTLFDVIKDASVAVDDLGVVRTPHKVLLSALTELGECAEDALAESGDSYKFVGPDGVVGEALDTIATLLDLIHVVDPTVTEQQLAAMVQIKMIKWVTKERQHVEQKASKKSTAT